MSEEKKPGTQYVSALPIPKGAQSLQGLRRIDLAKFYRLEDAQAHLEKLRESGAFADLKIETREE